MEHLNENGVKALTDVAEWLEAGAPHVTVDETLETIAKFDMSEVSGYNGCGTVCCIAGAVVSFNPLEFPQFCEPNSRVWYKVNEVHVAEHAEGDVFTDARKYLGMSEDDAEALFVPDDMHERTAKEGAEVIRHFIKTGVAKWPDIEE